MPESMLPPAEAAAASGQLLLWVIGVLVVVVVALWGDNRLQRGRLEKEHREDRAADADGRKVQWDELRELTGGAATMGAQVIAALDKAADAIERLERKLP